MRCAVLGLCLLGRLERVAGALGRNYLPPGMRGIQAFEWVNRVEKWLA